MSYHEKVFVFVAICLFLLVSALTGYWSYYSASVQAEVYERQGVKMTTWEVWMGAKPIERVISIKE